MKEKKKKKKLMGGEDEVLRGGGKTCRGKGKKERNKKYTKEEKVHSFFQKKRNKRQWRSSREGPLCFEGLPEEGEEKKRGNLLKAWEKKSAQGEGGVTLLICRRRKRGKCPGEKKKKLNISFLWGKEKKKKQRKGKLIP